MSDTEVKGLEASLDLAKHERSNLEETVTKQDAEIATLREQVKMLRDAAKGLSFGADWNNGTHAKIYRPKLLAALAATEQKP